MCWSGFTENNQMQNKYKIGFVFVLYKTPESELNRLTREIIDLSLEKYKIYFIDNTFNGRGYASGVNEGLRRAKKDGCTLFMIANPDISLKGINKSKLLAAAAKFDVWGYAMKQQGKLYYGGNIDPWLMTGGLNTGGPNTRFRTVEWVSGSL